QYGNQAEIWITEAGYSTIRHDEFRQLEVFVDAVKAPVKRIYWYGWHDLPEERSSIKGFHIDEREYHLGLIDKAGREKLLARQWRQQGLEGIIELAGWRKEREEQEINPPILITG